VDAVIYGKKLVALVEIAKTGEFADIEQLLEGARIFEKIRGEKPNALILFIYAEKPSEKLIAACEENGIIVNSSLKRIAELLHSLDENLSENIKD